MAALAGAVSASAPSTLALAAALGLKKCHQTPNFELLKMGNNYLFERGVCVRVRGGGGGEQRAQAGLLNAVHVPLVNVEAAI